MDRFTYTSFHVADDRRTVSFSYCLEHAGTTHNFTEVITFPVDLADGGAQDNTLRALHLALGISYYKIFIPGEIVQPYAMTAAEADFWNDVWQHGLGEFLYVNKLASSSLARFGEQPGMTFAIGSVVSQPGALLGIGGGKDSALAGELLKACDLPTTGFVMATGEQLGQTQAVAAAMGVDLLVVERQLDRSLLEVQEQPGAYKGHVPISLIFGLVGSALGIAQGVSYVVVANEASASIPRIDWEGTAVNHQWSKSFGFEQSLQRYVHQFVSPGLTYFSAVRQLTSVGVAKAFAQFPAYFEVFTSDNSIFRIDPAQRPSGRWSLESPKSLSSFMLLAPWLSEADMLRIFALNFLDQPALERLFQELTGLVGEPPLDCVGTVEELILSLQLASRQGKWAGSHLMQLAEQQGILTNPELDQQLATALSLQADSAIPADLQAGITSKLQELLA